METKENKFAKELFVVAVICLVGALVCGRYASIAATQFITMASTEESGVLFSLLLSSVLASFLLSVSVSFITVGLSNWQG